MTSFIDVLLLLCALPLIFVCAAYALIIGSLCAVLACPVLLFMARVAAQSHDWVLMWHRLSAAAVCGLGGVYLLIKLLTPAWRDQSPLEHDMLGVVRDAKKEGLIR